MNEDVLWSRNFIEMMQEIVGDSSLGFESCQVHLEYGQFMTITFRKTGWKDQVYMSEVFGTTGLSDKMRLPKGVQAITFESKEGEYTIAHIRFVPVDPDLGKFLDTLRGIEFFIREPV